MSPIFPPETWNAILTTCRTIYDFFRKVTAFSGEKQILVINGKGGKFVAEGVSADCFPCKSMFHMKFEFCRKTIFFRTRMIYQN